MTNAQCVLIDLLRKSLFNFDINIPEDTDWQAVYDEANFQAVIPLAFDGTAGIKGIPKDIYKKFKNHTVAVMLNNDKVIKGQWELTDLLEKNNVKYAILKGLSVARYYPKPELRTLGDVDFLVSKDDLDSTKQLLIDNGYVLDEKEDGHFHYKFYKNEVRFELHDEISDFPDSEMCRELRQELLKSVDNIENLNCKEISFSGFSDFYQAMSLLLHMERHFRIVGLGIRQLIDWGVFVKRTSILENTEFINFTKKYGIYKFAEACTMTFNKYFGGEEISDEHIDTIFELLLKKGNFGVKQTEELLIADENLSTNNNFVLKWFKFFKQKSLISWNLAKKYNWLSNFGFIVIPIRYAFRVIFKKRRKINYKLLVAESDKVNDINNYLNIFNSEKTE
ncbi:MAG: nucleotidyltransferase family protein [Acutalibacteraceae bacterium]|nr:nucleotidyltransferase family protein [Acutalibacteraceae bacterium]